MHSYIFDVLLACRLIVATSYASGLAVVAKFFGQKWFRPPKLFWAPTPMYGPAWEFPVRDVIKLSRYFAPPTLF